jgi:hypothetical protein
VAGFSLGNLAAALSITGSNPKLREELEAPAVAPMAEQPVPAVGAVEPAAPAVTAEAAPVAAPAPAQIEDQSFTGKGNLRAQSLAGTNRAMDLVTEAGDIKSEGDAKSADLYGQLSSEKREVLDAAKSRVAGNRGQKDELESKLFQQIDSISERQKNPPKDTMAMVMGIVGAVMAAKGNKGGAVAAQLMGQALGSKTQSWANGIESDKENLGHMMKMYGLQDSDSDNELDQAAKISALAAGQFDAALKQVAATTDSKEAKRAAEQARLGLRQQAVSAQMSIDLRAGKLKQTNALYNLIASQPTPELQAQVAAANGKAGQAILQDVQKSSAGGIKNAADVVGVQKTLADIEKSKAEAAKLAAETSGTGSEVVGGYKVANPSVWASVPAPAKAAFAKGQGSMPGLIATLTELKGLIEEHGTETLPGPVKSRMQALEAAALGGIKEASELGALDNGVANLVARQIGDATAWNMGLGNLVENADKRIGSTIADIQRSSAAKAATYGLESALGGRAATSQPAAPAQAPATVTMYRPDGKPVPVPVGAVDAAKARNWTTTAPAPAPQATAAPDVGAMDDAAYEEFVRRNG